MAKKSSKKKKVKKYEWALVPDKTGYYRHVQVEIKQSGKVTEQKTTTEKADSDWLESL